MRFYGLSEARVRRVLHAPHRVEEGVAPETAAYMQRVGIGRNPSEIWVMIQAGNTSGRRGGAQRSSFVLPRPSQARRGSGAKHFERVIISAWRYPGATKPRAPLPAAIGAEIAEALRRASGI